MDLEVTLQIMDGRSFIEIPDGDKWVKTRDVYARPHKRGIYVSVYLDTYRWWGIAKGYGQKMILKKTREYQYKMNSYSRPGSHGEIRFQKTVARQLIRIMRGRKGAW